MKKVLGAFLLVIAISMALTIYTEGVDQAYGGIFAGLAPDSPEEAQAERDRQAGRLAKQPGDSYGGTSQTSYKKLVDRVRANTDQAMRNSERRVDRQAPR
jgi:hypothetical protein